MLIADALGNLNPVTLVRARFRHWWQARLPLSDITTLTQRNVYILPTRPGLMLGLTLLVLLVASINYQLNLGYLLTFLLAGSAVVGMHVCHGTLRGITMHLTPPQAQFAGQPATFAVQLASTRSTPRYGIGLSVLGAAHWVWTDIAAGGSSSTVHVGFKPERRGLHRVPILTAETRFPLGTFRVWTIWRPAATQQAQRHELWLDLATAGRLDTEHGLSRLCAWVLLADRLNADYGLRVAGREVAPGRGEAHKRRCLQALALC